MDTARVQDLSKGCEDLKEMWGRLSRENKVELATIIHNPCGDIICDRIDTETTKEMSDDLQLLLKAQVHKYEDEIKRIVGQTSNKDLKLSL